MRPGSSPSRREVSKSQNPVRHDTLRPSTSVRAPAPSKKLAQNSTNERQMTISSANRTALFIDGANLYSTAKTLGFDIDYKLLLKEFQSHGTLVRAFYYTALAEHGHSPCVGPLLD